MSRIITVREALREALSEEMKRDSSVFLIGEEVAEYNGAYKISQGLLEEFGAMRVVDSPISEYGFAGLGVGAAFGGLKPIVEFMSFNFSMQAADAIINSAAKMYYMSGGTINCPIVFRGPNGSAYGVAAQHSQCYASWYAHIPGLKVIAPFFAADHKSLLKAAIRDPNPVVFLENELMYGEKHEILDAEDYVEEIGKAKVILPGSDVTIISFSLQMKVVLQAAEELKKTNIHAEIIDLRTLRPLDISTIITSVMKTHKVVVVEGGWEFSGIGAEICAQIVSNVFDYLDAPVVRVTGKDVPMPYAINLEQMAIPSVQDIIMSVKNLCV